MTKPRSTAPIVAAILLILPVLYVGSYLAMVKPEGHMAFDEREIISETNFRWEHYRYGDSVTSWLYWPLEQIDRKLRPSSWRGPSVMPANWPGE
jgi:hypothetical protein